MSQTTKNYGVITKFEDLERLIHRMGMDDEPIGFDIETGYEGPDRPKGAIAPHEDTFITGFSLTISPNWARYVPLRHDFSEANLPEAETWELMKPILESPRIVAHNLKFEKRHVRKVGIEIGSLADTMLQAYVIAEWKKHGLKELVLWIDGHEMTKIEELFPGATQKELDALRFNTLDPTDPRVVEYACEDSAWCLALYEKFTPMIAASADFSRIYKLEMEIMELMADAEDRGFAVDWDGIERAGYEGEKFISKLEVEAREQLGALVGRDLKGMNLGSTKQLNEVLYDPKPNGMGLKPVKLTPSGAPSTDKIALNKLAQTIPAIQRLLDSRNVANLVNRCVTWRAYSNSLDGRVHASYGQTQVPTGRFNANGPAIQQLPKRWRWALGGPWGDLDDDVEWAKVCEKVPPDRRFSGNFRNFLIAGEGCYLLNFDYSQIELRALAGLSQEKTLLDAFEQDKDVHSITAAMMLGKRVEDLHKHERAIGKTMNFALLYGMGAQSLGDRLALRRDEADRLYRAYFRSFATVTSWMERCRRDAYQNLATRSFFGRRAALWDLQTNDARMKGKGERAAVNYPVQGWAADYMKYAMCRAVRRLKTLGWYREKVWLIANLHDALTFEVSNELNPIEVMNELIPAVEFPIENFPKIVSEWDIGQSWGTSYPITPSTEVEWTGSEWRVVGQAAIESREESLDISPLPEDPDVTFFVKPTKMPTEAQFVAFLTLVRDNPGNNLVILDTEEGVLELDEVRTSLGIADEARIAMTLGGATCFQPAEYVDTEALVAELAL